ncbi:MAG: hypothetical protein M3Z30_00260 [Gemmatimonadota bacterium]|nr:hypothetical protein [Gemmatimonadota bacterium]
MRARVFAAVTCLVTACGGIDAISPPALTLPPISEVVVYTWPTYVQVGDTLRVQAGGFSRDGWEFTQPIRTVAWQTSNPDLIRIEAAVPVISIQPSVYARGLAPGNAHISATLNGVTGADSVIVLPRLQGVEVTPQTATIRVGQLLPVAARIVGSDGATIVGPRVVWSSSDYSVANFGGEWSVLGQHPGVAHIAASLARAVGGLDVTVVP